MINDNMSANTEVPAHKEGVSRRSLILAAGWSAPAIAVATASPAKAASQEPECGTAGNTKVTNTPYWLNPYWEISFKVKNTSDSTQKYTFAGAVNNVKGESLKITPSFYVNSKKVATYELKPGKEAVVTARFKSPTDRFIAIFTIKTPSGCNFLAIHRQDC